MYAELLAQGGPLLDFVHQHAGKSRYDQGDWRAAEQHFRTALDLREDLELQASSALALDAANACATAAEAAVELHRSVPPVHRLSARFLHGERPPHVPILGDLASVLAHGPMPLQAVKDPVRRRIEAATDRKAARPYRSLTADARAELLSGLRNL